MAKPIDEAFDLINSDLSPEDLLEAVEALEEKVEGVDALMFPSVYEAMIVAGRHPDFP